MLALLGGVLIFFAAVSAIHQILAAVGLLVCVTCLGSAKLIELMQTHLDRTSEQRRLEREHWTAHIASTHASPPTPLPPLPGTEKWHVEINGEIRGPLGVHEVRALRDKQALGPDSYVFREGWTQWAKLKHAEI